MMAVVVADWWGAAMADGMACLLVAETGRYAVAKSDDAMADKMAVLLA